MSDTEERNFENSDLITLLSETESVRPSILDEIEHGKSIYEKRHVLKRADESEKIRPLYESQKELKQKSQRVPKQAPNYYYRLECRIRNLRPLKPCKHTGQLILNRDILTRREHDAFLAQPRVASRQPRYQMVYQYKKKYYSPCTQRIEQLAVPLKRRVVTLWNEYGDKLGPEKVELLAKTLMDANVMDVGRAVELCNDEKRKSEIKMKKVNRDMMRIKKKIASEKMSIIKKIADNIFIAMRKFLLSDHNFGVNYRAKIISDILARKIIDFGGYENVDRDTDDVLARSIYGLADGLALWMHKMTQVCNFGTVLSSVPDTTTVPADDTCLEDGPYKYYEIDDYISYESEEATTFATGEGLSEMEEDFTEGFMGEDDMLEYTNYKIPASEFAATEGETDAAADTEAEAPAAEAEPVPAPVDDAPADEPNPEDE